jgi:NAD(P)-dependent dehydrogenase (short-subunit alcohol dehydrogenase family)
MLFAPNRLGPVLYQVEERAMSKLAGKVAVVTGGSSGIGLAIAQRFIEEGAYVFIVARRETELKKVKALIGRNVSAVSCDITKASDLERMKALIAVEKGRVDVIVASAGLTEQQHFENATHEHFDKTFDLNARGTYFSVQKLLPLMTNGGSIVLVSSGMSYLGIPGHSAYAATKAAVRSFSRTWAAELKGRGIRVNTLSPGAIDTPILDSQATTKEEGDKLRAFYANMTPLGRLGFPREMASAALFLASEESSYCTGTDLIADGGITQL